MQVSGSAALLLNVLVIDLAMVPARRGGASDRERHRPLRGNHSFFFSGCSRNSCACGSACSRTDQRAFASTGNPTYQGSGRRATADFRDVALLMALSMKRMRTGRDSLTIYFGETYRNDTRSVQSAAGFC